MLKNLYLLRHATAEEPSNSSMVKDIDRELLQKGIMESARMGEYLKKNGIIFDTIYCSPSTRTTQTANMVVEQTKIDIDQVIFDDKLYGGGPRGYLALLNGVMESEQSICMIGHNPDITFFAEYLTRDDIGGDLDKCTLIHLTFENLRWDEISQKSAKVASRLDIEALFENE